MLRTLAIGTLVLLSACGGDTARTPSMPSTHPSPSLPAGPVNQVERFQVTFTADSACTTLPTLVRSRTYSAEVAGGSTLISLGGGTFGEASERGYPSRWNVIYQQVRENAAIWSFQDPEIWEHLGAGSYAVIYGGPARIDLETGSMNPQAGESPFWGRFTYCAEMEPDSYPECAVPEVSCESGHHTLTLVRP